MPDGKKPWEKYSKSEDQEQKPWEKFSSVKKKDQPEIPSDSGSTQGRGTSSLDGEGEKKVQPSASSTGKSKTVSANQNLLNEISSIDRNLISKEEEEVVPFLNNKFKKHGFTFEETGAGDALIVKNKKGESIDVDLNNWTTSGNESEARKLKDFLSKTKSLESTEEASKIFSKTKRTKQEEIRLKELTERQASLDNMFVDEFDKKDNKENYKNQAKKDLDEELAGTGVLNTLRDAGISIWNNAIDALPVSTPLGAQIKGVANTLKADKNTLEKKIREIKSNPENSKLSNSEIQQKAYQQALDERADDLRQSEVNKFLSGMDDKTKELLQADKILQQSSLNDKIKESEIKHAAILKLAESKAKKYLDAVKNFGEDSDEAIRLKEEVNEKIKDLQSIQKNLYSDKYKLGTVDDEIDLLKRNYGALENFTGKYTSMAGQSIGGLLKTGIEFSGINPAAKVSLSNDLNSIIDNSEKITENLRKPISRVTDASDFIDYWSDTMATQAPDLILNAMLGEASLGTTFLSQYGQKKRSMEKEIESGKAKYTKEQMMLVPALYAGSEVVSEIPTVDIIKKMGRVNKAIQADDVLRRNLYETVYDKMTNNLSGYVKDQSKEIAGELFTNSIQNATDKYVLSKKDVGIFDNSKDIIKDTALLTTTLQSSPHVFGALTKPFTRPEYTDLLDRNSKEIASLIKKIENPETSSEVKKILEEKVNKLTLSSNEIVNDVISKIDSMPENIKERIVGIEKKQSDLRAKAATIRDDKTIDIGTKKQLLNDLKNDFSKIENERIGILSNDPEYINNSKKKEVTSETQGTQEEVGIPDEIANLNDNELITFTVKTLDEVPEQFIDKAKKIGGQDIETRKLILGLPLGKKETVKTPEAYVYSLTGKEAKDYAIQKQEKSKENSLPLFEQLQNIETTKQKNRFLKNNPTVAFVQDNLDTIIDSVEGAQLVEC